MQRKRNSLLFLCFTAIAAHGQQNYVRTFTPLVEVAPGTPLNEENSRVSTDYYDRAGRKVQTVLHRASPDGKDMADLTMYDGLGRVARRWASLPIGGTNGAYVHPDVFGTCAYRGNYHIDYEYEPSSLSRLVKETNRNTRGHAITTDYLYTDKVPEFEMVNETTIRNVGTGRRTCKGVKVTDENGASRIEYTDLWGRLMMTERIGFFGDTLRTCYVYDRFDNLCCVLPPMAMEALPHPGTYSLGKAVVLDKYAYFYRYDRHGYCIAKKLPGAGWTYMVNDRAGRPVLIQQPMQRSRGEWSFTFYDSLGRVALTGTLATAVWHKDLVEPFSIRLFNLVPSTTSEYGFNKIDLGIKYWDFKVHQAFYYDHYDFLKIPLFQNKFSANDTAEHYSARCKLTLSYTATLDHGSGCELSLFTYDHRGRMKHSVVKNTVSNFTTRHTYAYDFVDNVIEKRIYYTYNGFMFNHVYHYKYDRQGREVEAKLDITNYSSFIPRKYSYPLRVTTYDEFGRPSTRTTFNGKDTETYTYRDDGKLKTYGGKDFKHTLYYDEDVNLFGPPSYNGMITALGVKQAGNEYEFHMQYDGFNRLNGVASQGIPGGFKGFMSYDKNGNITSKYVGTLRKHINYIEFNYDGNHIKSTADIKGEHWPAEGYMDIFYEAHRDTTAYAYDKNGNEVRNLSQNVAHAHYNVLNLPDTVRFKGGNMLYIRYMADGRRIQTVSKTFTTSMSDPTDYIHNAGDPHTVTTEISDRGMSLCNGRQIRINFEGGYTLLPLTGKNALLPYYYVTDYLGSIRAVCNGKTGEVLQSMEYSPSGLIFRRTNYGLQSKRYCGKEELTMHGYNMYDSGARFQYSLIPRFNTMDPLCEKFYDVSPYAYCNGDPINRIDPDGKDDYFFTDGTYSHTNENGTDYIRIIQFVARNNFSYELPWIKKNIPNSILLSQAELSAKAYSKIFTRILAGMVNVNLRNVHNNQISVTVWDSNSNWYSSCNFYNDSGMEPEALATTIKKEGRALITAYIYPIGNINRDFYNTVSNVQNILGEHEYYGHFVKGWGDNTSTHHKVFDFQMHSPSWSKTTKFFKQHHKGKYEDYLKKEKEKK